uniref:Uncharacterized protein n=1 Tax=Peromyscus maniculatus bairdii TaxID=230844 RepID=A0A8C8UJI6_PERMB
MFLQFSPPQWEGLTGILKTYVHSGSFHLGQCGLRKQAGRDSGMCMTCTLGRPQVHHAVPWETIFPSRGLLSHLSFSSSCLFFSPRVEEQVSFTSPEHNQAQTIIPLCPHLSVEDNYSPFLLAFL